MRILEGKGIKEYYAKKRAIDAAIEYFQKNPKQYFVSLVAEWDDELHGVSGQAEVIARREIISQFYGIDFVVSQDRDLSKFAPRDKDQYLELWDGLVKHEVQDERVKKNDSLLKRLRNTFKSSKIKEDEFDKAIRDEDRKG